MITGRVTARREAIVQLQLRAADGSPDTVEAIIDTGFTGFLALPADWIGALGLPLAGLQRTFLADGSETVLIAYEATVHWHGEEVVVKTLEVERSALVGMSLLDGSLVTMEITKGGSVRIEPMGETT